MPPDAPACPTAGGACVRSHRRSPVRRAASRCLRPVRHRRRAPCVERQALCVKRRAGVGCPAWRPRIGRSAHRQAASGKRSGSGVESGVRPRPGLCEHAKLHGTVFGCRSTLPAPPPANTARFERSTLSTAAIGVRLHTASARRRRDALPAVAVRACLHHSATLPSACRQTGLRQRCPVFAISRTFSSSTSMPSPGPCGIATKPSA